jgi:hypothetical protein
MPLTAVEGAAVLLVAGIISAPWCHSRRAAHQRSASQEKTPHGN